MTDFAYDEPPELTADYSRLPMGRADDYVAEPQPAEWAQPAAPFAVLLRHLATDFDSGAPTFYSIMFKNSSEVNAQLSEPSPATLSAWARILGVTTVKLEQQWGPSGRDHYSACGLYAGVQLEVWGAWSPDHDDPPAVTFIPVAELDRGFDPAPQS